MAGRPAGPAAGAALGAALLLTLAGCAAAGPRALVLNEDQCGYCRMEISDARFGTQVITSTGKVHVFDSVECLAGYLRGAAGDEPRGVWVANAEQTGEWVKAAEAGYLIDAELRSPMGSIVTFASPEAARAAQQRLGGALVSWTAVREDSAGITGHGAH